MTAQQRVTVDGKQFGQSGRRFQFRGVTYGTFEPRDDGARFPAPATVAADFAAMAGAGFTVVRTYTSPADDVRALAAEHGLQLLAGVFYPDWRYLVGASRRQAAAMARAAEVEVRAEARRLAGDDGVVALCVGNEIPADVVRWCGTKPTAALISRLAAAVREEDPDRLVTYANYPTAEYLPLDDLDFLTFNVYLERRADFRRYLTRLHNLAGDRPLVLGEMGRDSAGTAAGEAAQAEALDWQLETAVERGVAGTCVFSWTDEWWVGDAAVEGWHFGLTRADRSPKPALEIARRWNGRTVADLEANWPSISVVVCAYNAADTLDECLRHACALEYPALEIIVADDGSTDDTAAIAARHAKARLLELPHAGLSATRNAGAAAATGELVAYLDADAYPTPEWPYFLALGLDGRNVGGVGGPNVGPKTDPEGAQAVARAPGGPMHVLVGDDRAEHVPGCNMAFWRDVLTQVGGFDPVYTSAGDDVDLCWKVLDAGWEIGFHPAALVWHHRRSGARTYLRQQRGYGGAEALVAARHPHRFNRLGTARWRGRIYARPSTGRRGQRAYHGLYGGAAYQSVYGAPSLGVEIAHQMTPPFVVAAVAAAPLAGVWPRLAAIPLAVAAALVVLVLVDMVRARPPIGYRGRRLAFRALVAWLCLAQPMARLWGRARHAAAAQRNVDRCIGLPGPARVVAGGVILLPEDRPRPQVAAQIIACLAAAGLRCSTPTGWEDHDAALAASSLVDGELLTSAHAGAVQVRIRPRLRRGRLALALAAVGVLAAAAGAVPALALSAATAWELGRGLRRAGPGARRAIVDAAAAGASVVLHLPPVGPRIVTLAVAGVTDEARRSA
jgi:O-antigen biosynthesis protein